MSLATEIQLQSIVYHRYTGTVSMFVMTCPFIAGDCDGDIVYVSDGK